MDSADQVTSARRMIALLLKEHDALPPRTPADRFERYLRQLAREDFGPADLADQAVLFASVAALSRLFLAGSRHHNPRPCRAALAGFEALFRPEEGDE